MKRIFIILLLFITSSLLAQPITWQRAYKSTLNNDHQAFTICPSEGTNIFVAGLTSDPRQGYIFKLNQFGDTLWRKFLPQNEFITCSVSLIDGGCLLAGYEGNLVRVSSDGSIIRTNYAGAYEIWGLQKISDSLILFIGLQNETGVIGKCDLNCNVKWVKFLDQSSHVHPYSICSDLFNNIYVCGYKFNLSNDSSVVFKTDTSGNISWQHTFLIENNSIMKHLIVVADGLIVSGIMNPVSNPNRNQVFLLKTTLTGDSVKTVFFPSQYNEYYNTLLKTSPDNFYFSYSRDTLVYEISVIGKFDKDLNLKKSVNLFPLKDYVDVNEMIFARDSPYGEIYLAGETDINSVGQVQFYVARIDSSLNYLPPPIAVNQLSTVIPKEFALRQNYPNPFNPQTKIVFDVSNEANVKLTVFDVLGREVMVLTNGKLKAGTYEAVFNGKGLASGMYFYELRSGDFKETRKMILVK